MRPAADNFMLTHTTGVGNQILSPFTLIFPMYLVNTTVLLSDLGGTGQGDPFPSGVLSSGYLTMKTITAKY